MSARQSSPAVLDGKLVLDLTGVEGWLCGLLLAGFGAEVIKVEPPGGDPGRHLPPLAKGVPGDFSLYWFAWNRGKKSLTIDPADPEALASLRGLAARADFLLESGTPGRLAPLGLDYATLQADNPRLVYVSISPFGQTGPFAAYRSSDLVAHATGGHMYLDGADELPMRPGMDATFAQAGVQAAVGAMIAHYHREATGRGQWLDLSQQEAIAFTLDSYAPGWDISRAVNPRHGVGRRFVGLRIDRVVFRCTDGWVCEIGYLGLLGGRPEGALELLALAGVPHDDLLTPEWQARLHDPWFRPEGADEQRLIEVTTALAAKFSRAELVTECQKRRILASEVLSPGELLANGHLRERGFWLAAEVPELGLVQVPGPPFILERTPWRTPLWLAAPGEHNDEILRPAKPAGDTPK